MNTLSYKTDERLTSYGNPIINSSFIEVDKFYGETER
jgi:hypothetical protein